MNRTKATLITLIALAAPALTLGACSTSTEIHDSIDGGIDPTEIGRTLDAWHEAASRGDLEAYFGVTTEGFVFMGTDPGERWTRDEFRAYATPRFADGHGWTYRPVERYASTNSYGDVAWVDEILRHETYGTMRGTAVLRSPGYGDQWYIAHYTLSFVIPNEKTGAVLEVLARD